MQSVAILAQARGQARAGAPAFIRWTGQPRSHIHRTSHFPSYIPFSVTATSFFSRTSPTFDQESDYFHLAYHLQGPAGQRGSLPPPHHRGRSTYQNTDIASTQHHLHGPHGPGAPTSTDSLGHTSHE